MLNALRNVSWTSTGTYIELHTASPGAAGTTSVSVGSTVRLSATYSAASGGAIALSGAVGPWTNGGTTETITDVAIWTASTAGTFLWSAPLTVQKAWASGDTLTLNTCTLSIVPLAA
ncbi:MAG: hypothetical protein KDB97_12785 [Flavobacteriales bacterium]|jgi:hypothetical protein|nr:hypothetical protein [Flavobacteriales bacterium]